MCSMAPSGGTRVLVSRCGKHCYLPGRSLVQETERQDTVLYVFQDNIGLCPKDPDLSACWPRTAKK